MINPPFNYTGSKFSQLPELVKMFDQSKTTFKDLFVGGGSVYANVLELYDHVMINDIIPELVEIHTLSLVDPKNFIAEVEHLCVTTFDDFYALRSNFNSSRDPRMLYALMICCTNNMIRFNKKFEFNQSFGKRTFNKSIQQKFMNYSAHIHAYSDKITPLSQHFSEVEVSPTDMIYLDPPYSNTLAGYNRFWNSDDTMLLYKYCHDIHDIGASFALSGTLLHDGKTDAILDKLKDEFQYHSVDIDYNKVSRRGKKLDTTEILVTNYDVVLPQKLPEYPGFEF